MAIQLDKMDAGTLSQLKAGCAARYGPVRLPQWRHPHCDADFWACPTGASFWMLRLPCWRLRGSALMPARPGLPHLAVRRRTRQHVPRCGGIGMLTAHALRRVFV
eukprot:353679-Chlamydomonas_euryale.AAC.5